MCADLVELPMHDFDVILGMEWIHNCYARMDCRSRVVRFRFPNEEDLVWEGYNLSHPNPLISDLKSNKIISKGLLYHHVSVNDLDDHIPSVDSVLVVNELKDVFHDNFPRVSPNREIDFAIYLEPDTKPI